MSVLSSREVSRSLHSLASPEVAASSARYFKTGPGEYGEGDRFVGVRVPVLRKLAREFRALPLHEIETLLHSGVHEERQLSLFILVLSVGRCDAAHREAAYDLYCRNLAYVNNWDLVDCSAPAVVGGHLRDRSRQPLKRLAQAEHLWSRRVAIVATQHFIRHDDFADTLAISRLLLSDSHDLIHKATGWMLREVGDRDRSLLTAFLNEHVRAMPRTMLRYAIEKLPEQLRKTYLART